MDRCLCSADVAEFSQFGHEQEVLFPPLMALEVQNTDVDGSILIVHSKLSLNMTSLTLEQVAWAPQPTTSLEPPMFVYCYHTLAHRMTHFSRPCCLLCAGHLAPTQATR